MDNELKLGEVILGELNDLDGFQIFCKEVECTNAELEEYNDNLQLAL